MKLKKELPADGKHVLYLGDWVFHVGPMFIETPFGTETKDADLHFYGERVVEAFEHITEVTSLANWELYRLAPGKLEEYLAHSECLVISDVEAKCFHLYPSFFDRSRRENKVVTFPDRLNIIKEWVADGGGLMMLGGWLSFSGVQAKSAWGRSLLNNVLPVDCLLVEDLVESSAGFTAEVVNPEHPAVKGLPWDKFPPIFGYNEVSAKPDAEVLVRVKETGHPLVVAGEYGKGRLFTYMSDPAPHWGINFELWEGYDAFWQQALNWVKKAKIQRMSKELLFAGAAVVDITPPLEVGLLTSSVKGSYEPFASIRTPLKARVLVLKNNLEMIAVVSLDLLALNDTSVGGWNNFKSAVAGAVSADKVILTCTHTHNAPESVGLSDLYLTAVYRDWLMAVQQKIKGAIDTAILLLKPCRVFIGLDTLAGYNMQRRIPTPGGVIMSDSIQPIAPELLERGPVDRRIYSIRFKDESNKVIATLVHAVCHPVHEMCIPHLSAEFPGEVCMALEASQGNGVALFLNGAAGDINPPTVSCGPEHAVKHGRAIAQLVEKRDGAAIADRAFSFLNRSRQLNIRPGSNMTNQNDAIARLSAIRLGPVAILFLPGEPFTETAWTIEENSPFEQTIVVAYAENNIGYVPTPLAAQQGGYEAGPGKWSFLEPGAEGILTEEALLLLNELYHK